MDILNKVTGNKISPEIVEALCARDGDGEGDGG